MMKKLLASAGIAASVAAVSAQAQNIEINANGSTPTRNADPTQFEGRVLLDGLTTESSVTSFGSGLVSFAPGARTAWHSHPAGQWLYVTAGKGWVQQQGQAVQEIKAGDAIWIPAGVKHWHGATDKTSMSHIGITPYHEGNNVTWMEQVSDADYRKQ